MTRFLTNSMRFITTISEKNHQKHNHYSHTGSEMNKSQNRPKRIQREQTLLFGATMHDFSGWSGLVVLQPKQKNITGTFF